MPLLKSRNDASNDPVTTWEVSGHLPSSDVVRERCFMVADLSGGMRVTLDDVGLMYHHSHKIPMAIAQAALYTIQAIDAHWPSGSVVHDLAPHVGPHRGHEPSPQMIMSVAPSGRRLPATMLTPLVVDEDDTQDVMRVRRFVAANDFDDDEW